MGYVKEYLRTEKKIKFGNTQKRSNNIELEVLADTVYVKVNYTTFLNYSREVSIFITFILL